MTIKARNRITLVFLITTILVFVLEVFLFLLQYSTGVFQYPDFSSLEKNSSLLFFKYNTSCVLIGFVLENIYVCLSNFFILRSFEKTQSSEVFFFELFLLAIFFDSFRIIIPLFNLSETYSTSLLIIGNLPLFAKILLPLSLMGSVILSSNIQHQDLEKTGTIFIVASAFLAQFIPLNTSIIEPNFLVSYGYSTTIRITTILIHLANIFTLFIKNRERETSQFSTLGYLMLTGGAALLCYSINLFNLIFGFILISLGTYIFLKEIHKFYLWND